MTTIKTLTVTFGEEHFSPQRYEGFRVGPLTVEVEMNEGETPLETIRRIKEVLNPAWDELFINMRNKFHEHNDNKM